VLFQNHASISTFGDMSNLTYYENIPDCAIPLFALQDARNR
jgi:hypothetical protein